MVRAGAGEGWLKEVCTAPGVTYPLPEQQPHRDETLHTVRARDVHDALWPLSDELRSLVRIEAEWNSEGGRKPKMFTLVYRLGEAGDRIERHVSMTLNKALTEANRASGGSQVLCWRAKTRGEKRKRAAVKQEQTDGGAGGRGGGQGRAGQGKGKGKGNGNSSRPAAWWPRPKL